MKTQPVIWFMLHFNVQYESDATFMLKNCGFPTQGLDVTRVSLCCEEALTGNQMKVSKRMLVGAHSLVTIARRTFSNIFLSGSTPGAS